MGSLGWLLQVVDVEVFAVVAAVVVESFIDEVVDYATGLEFSLCLWVVPSCSG